MLSGSLARNALGSRSRTRGSGMSDPHESPTELSEPGVKIFRWRITRKAAMRFVVGFAVSLVVGKLTESLFDADALDGLYSAQEAWIDAVNRMNPLELAGTFIRETVSAFRDDGAHILSPAIGLFVTLRGLFDENAFAGLLQISLGILAVSSFNLVRTEGSRAFYGELHASGRLLENLLLWPLSVVAAASIIAFALQMLMLGALFLFQWLTGLAALAAGATGVAGGCWYCVTKLGEKGAEHALTPKI